MPWACPRCQGPFKALTYAQRHAEQGLRSEEAEEGGRGSGGAAGEGDGACEASDVC